jgi:formylglycine-generating enzyme required for sulfatase activity
MLPLMAAAAPPAPGTAFRACEDCPEMIVIPAGSFVMGRPGAERRSGAAAAEAEPVAMRIRAPFALSRLEVTRRQYARFIEDSGHEPRPGCRTWDPALARFNEDARRDWRNPATPAQPVDDHPVSCVSHADATAYARWLAQKTGEPYRLPSEAEWEYAARAGSLGLRYWGEEAEDGCDQANTYDVTTAASYRLGWDHAGCRDGYADLAPAGSFLANPFGLHDMIGNVREWVEDCATGSYAGRPRDGRAWTWLGGCGQRVVRGGSWLSPPDAATSAARAAADGNDRADDTGFRVALDLGDRTASGGEH